MNDKHKNIIIVGGASGIGFETAQKFLDNGAESVIIASRNAEKMNAAKGALHFSDAQNVYCIPMDITKVGLHGEFFLRVENTLGAIPDALVISSGINADSGNWKGFNVSEELYDKVMDTNLKGVFFLLRNFTNYIWEKKAKANICVVSSISAHRDLLGPYQFSKNVISGIVQTYGKYLAERGIVLNCVEPGTTDTPMMPHLAQYTDGIRDGKAWGDNSIHRVIKPEEIADAILYLMSDREGLLSGTCLLVAGGCKTIHRGY